jgi:hypothetical protein
MAAFLSGHAKGKVPGYSGVDKALKELVSESDKKDPYAVVCDRPISAPNCPYFYHFRKNLALSKINYQHEQARAELYVSLTLAKLIHVKPEPPFVEWWINEDPEFMKFGLCPDAYAILEVGASRVVFFEIDRGSEKLAVIGEKIDKYVRLGGSHPEDKFHVLFVTLNSRDSKATETPKQTSASRALAIQRLIRERGHKYPQFLSATHENLLSQPVGPILLSGASDVPLTVPEVFAT